MGLVFYFFSSMSCGIFECDGYIPSNFNTNSCKQNDNKLLASKLHRLKVIRGKGVDTYNYIHKELLQKKKSIYDFSFRLDMAAVVYTAIFSCGLSCFKALKNNSFSIDFLTKDIAKRSFGVGFQPQNQGVVQGVVQNIVNYGDNLTPNEGDHEIIAISKILAGTFIDISSPSYWSKKINGGSGEVELDECIKANEYNRRVFLTIIDASISKVKSQLNHEIN